LSREAVTRVIKRFNQRGLDVLSIACAGYLEDPFEKWPFQGFLTPCTGVLAVFSWVS